MDVAQGKVTKTIHTGEEPEGVAVTPNGKLVYSTSEDDGTLSVIDAGTAKLLKTFKIGRRPRNVVLMPDGKSGYANAENDRGVVFFDAIKNEKERTIPLGIPGQIKPMGLALSPDGLRLYVTTVEEASYSSWTRRQTWLSRQALWENAPGESLFHLMRKPCLQPSNDIAVVDTASQTVVKKISVPGSPWGVVAVQRQLL